MAGPALGCESPPRPANSQLLPFWTSLLGSTASVSPTQRTWRYQELVVIVLVACHRVGSWRLFPTAGWRTGTCGRCHLLAWGVLQVIFGFTPT
jgi:hypothetical protein